MKNFLFRILLFFLILTFLSCGKKTNSSTPENNIHKNLTGNFSLNIADGYREADAIEKADVIRKYFSSAPSRSSVLLNKNKKAIFLLYRSRQLKMVTGSKKLKILNSFEDSLSDSLKKIESKRDRNSVQINFSFGESDKTKGIAKISLIPDLWAPNKYSVIISFLLTEKEFFEGVESDFDKMMGSLRNI